MKTKERGIIMIGMTIFSIGPVIYGQYGPFELGNDDTIITQNLDQTMNTEIADDPLREGAYLAIDAEDATVPEAVIGNIIGLDSPIGDHDTALGDTLSIIRNIINYALGLISFVALIYLIYHGILMVTAAGNDAQYKKGMKGLKFAAFAIAGVGASWFIISFIFWLIEKITTGL